AGPSSASTRIGRSAPSRAAPASGGLEAMLATILNAFQVADIRKKIAFTGAMLLIYRFGSHVPVPGVNLTAVNNIQKQFGGTNILGLLNLFSGGGLSKLAIFALGIMPYITASIILQLLQVAVPSLEKL